MTEEKEWDQTEILTLPSESVEVKDLLDSPGIEKASRLLLDGHCVAFPTETVYGLGANGLDEKACAKIFEIKGRPQDNPLILHTSSLDMLEDLISARARSSLPSLRALMDKAWPGPLTLIFEKSAKVPDVVTAAGPTIAIRMPKNPIALALIEKTGHPLAAPSANRSGRPSPTKAQDVYEDLQGLIPLILDGGPCQIGIESTVLDLSGNQAMILRPGYFTKEDLDPYFDQVAYDQSLLTEGEIPKSPGQKYRHYAPKAQMYILLADNLEKIDACLEDFIQDHGDQKVGVLLFEENRPQKGADESLSQGSIHDLQGLSQSLFANLREMDRRQVDIIYAVGLKEESGLALSIMNRMKKSASQQIIYCS